MSATSRNQQKSRTVRSGPRLKRADYAQPRPVRFPREEDKVLEKTAQQLGVSVAELVRICVRVVNPSTLSPQVCDIATQLRQHLKGGVGA